VFNPSPWPLHPQPRKARVLFAAKNPSLVEPWVLSPKTDIFKAQNRPFFFTELAKLWYRAIMEPQNSYFIWGIDDSPYGPVALAMLMEWINDGRVVADTWVFERSSGSWGKASQFPELKEQFNTAFTHAPSPLTPGLLRRIKILSNLKDAQLAHLADFMEIQEAPQHAVVFRQGDVGDAMFLVLAGEFRARTMVGESESLLASFGAGDFFGDMALFDNGPRSADVVANVDSSLLKISAVNFYRLVREAPALATPFLQATARTLASRIRADNRRLTQMAEQFSVSRRM
jgi:CRP-like cAMP-binding protein